MLLGAACLVAGRLLPLPVVVTNSAAGLALGVLAVWLVAHVAAGRKRPRGKAAFAGDRALYERVLRESREATGRYLQSVTRSGLLRKSALYERPWFLVLGPKRSGKSFLLAEAGLHVPLRYPSDGDGMDVDNENRVRWIFADNAVWIDMPGAFTVDAGAVERQALAAALREIRPDRAVDGVVLVLNVANLLSGDAATTKRQAEAMRQCLDGLIAAWGIELPVSLVFSHADEIQGFDETFAGTAGELHNQVFGASFTRQQRQGEARGAFVGEYATLCESVNRRRMQLVARQSDDARCRMICRFAIGMEGARERLADLVAELFRPTSYEGRPVLRGFYFTGEGEAPMEKYVASRGSGVPPSQTIAGHPLNPGGVSGAARSHDTAKEKEARVLFALPLLDRVLPSEATPGERTQRRSRQEALRYYGALALVVVCTIAVAAYVWIAGGNAIRFSNEMRRELVQMRREPLSRVEAYRQLGKMGSIFRQLREYRDHGAPLSMGLWLYRGDRLLENLREEYFGRVRKLVIAPAVRQLEDRIRFHAGTPGVLTGEAYTELHSLLKTYLSISEEVSDHLDRIEPRFLDVRLLDAVTRILLDVENRARLPRDIEAVLRVNIALYADLLREGEFPLIQEDRALVIAARDRLHRLPDAQCLYETLARRLALSAARLGFADLLGGEPEILLSDTAISVLYTQDGWDHHMAAAIEDASRNPYRIDWVLGATKEDFAHSGPDPNRLRRNMTTAYFHDVKQQWLGFLASVRMDPFGGIDGCMRVLRKVGKEQSEFCRLLTRVGELTHIREQGLPGSKMVDKAVGESVRGKADAVEALLPRGDTRELDLTFGPLREFVLSESGPRTGMSGYCERILSLSEKLVEAGSGGSAGVVKVFDGRETDPLLAAWQYVESRIAGMPDDLGHVLEPLLLLPLRHAGTAVSGVLCEQLNSLWGSDVARISANRLAGRFPFAAGRNEARFDEVMDFFRPSTGTFWGFYDRRLFAFIEPDGDTWRERGIGSLDVTFSSELRHALTRAARIRNSLFLRDGSLRVQEFVLCPARSNKCSAVLRLGGQEYALGPAAGDVLVQWPGADGAQGASLEVALNGSTAGELVHRGHWGFHRLLADARITAASPTVLTARWDVNVQNMYVVFFACEIRAMNDDHPFGEDLFAGFECPETIANGSGKLGLPHGNILIDDTHEAVEGTDASG